MAIAIGAGFKLRSPQPDFERALFATLNDMKNYSDSYLPDMYVASCTQTGKVYIYNKENDFDEKTGKWREFEGATTISTEIVTTLDVGGVPEGSVFESGTDVQVIMQQLFTGDAPMGDKMYYCVQDDTVIDINNMTATGKQKVTVSPANQFVIFVVPKEVRIYDNNGLDNTTSFTKGNMVVSGKPYYSYISEVKITASDFIYKLV